MTNFKTVISNYVSDESGATAIEYGLIAALISIALIGGAKIIGTKVSSTFTEVGTSME